MEHRESIPEMSQRFNWLLPITKVDVFNIMWWYPVQDKPRKPFRISSYVTAKAGRDRFNSR